MTTVAWAPTAPDLLNTLRPAIVADLIRRVVELRGGQADVHSPEGTPDLLRYNVHPAVFDAPPGVVDVAVGAASPGRLTVTVGPVSGTQPAVAEPLAVRLLLLAAPHAAPVAVDVDALGDAVVRLARWRHVVANAASAPSAAPPAGYLARLHERSGDDLDTPGLLDLVDRIIGDDGVPAGGRFEFLMYADRLLGLDLAAGLGS